jgi:hypothetical protein
MLNATHAGPGKLDDAMRWVIGPEALANRVGENRAEQADSARGNAISTTDHGGTSSMATSPCSMIPDSVPASSVPFPVCRRAFLADGFWRASINAALRQAIHGNVGSARSGWRYRSFLSTKMAKAGGQEVHEIVRIGSDRLAPGCCRPGLAFSTAISTSLSVAVTRLQTGHK